MYHQQKADFWPFWRNCEDKLGRTDARARNLNSDGHVLHHNVDWASSVQLSPIRMWSSLAADKDA